MCVKSPSEFYIMRVVVSKEVFKIDLCESIFEKCLREGIWESRSDYECICVTKLKVESWCLRIGLGELVVWKIVFGKSIYKFGVWEAACKNIGVKITL